MSSATRTRTHMRAGYRGRATGVATDRSHLACPSPTAFNALPPTGYGGYGLPGVKGRDNYEEGPDRPFVAQGCWWGIAPLMDATPMDLYSPR